MDGTDENIPQNINIYVHNFRIHIYISHMKEM